MSDGRDGNQVFSVQQAQMQGFTTRNVLRDDFGMEIPVESVPLPSEGKIYPADSAAYSRETVEIRAMTAKEEDILTSRALIKKGTVISELIKSCVVDKTIDIDSLILGDRNAIMTAVRVTGYGAEYRVEVVCPSCSEKSSQDFNLGELPIKRLKIVASFNKRDDHGRKVNSPKAMILDVVPVIPPDLRPMVQLDGGRFATSDLNDLYRRVINRNNRLKRLLDLGAPEIIVNNEKRMLQEAVDALFDNGRRGRPVTGPGNRPLKSLSDMLKGKQGRFRQNLLGKRVDYSGRSVIVIGPNLQLHQCGLPKLMALELFKPFVMKRLVDAEYAQNIKSAKRMVERRRPQVWDVLEGVIKEHPVLLNRAPTLHRLGIQAFEPVLVEGKAIQVHPLVCTAFNADFDGDQMAVHLPLSAEAQAEARVLMLSSNNILSPATGRPITVPTQDMVFGIYYLTLEETEGKGEGRIFRHAYEVERAFDAGDVDVHASITLRPEPTSALAASIVRMADPERSVERAEDGTWVIAGLGDDERVEIETTPGRLFFNLALPDGFPYINTVVGKKHTPIGSIVEDVAANYPKGEVAASLDRIKSLGFRYGAQSGLTISIDDVVTPADKAAILDRYEKDAEKAEAQFKRGIITDDERRQKEIEIWTSANSEVGKAMEASLAGIKFNPIDMMVDSGARGNSQQIRQIAGMKGLVSNPRGEMIPRPIKSSFREGLSVLEYFISTHGARKGLADTALKTANSGYLTRRLVDVAQDCIIFEEDCGTERGLTMRAVVDGGDVIEPLSERVLGRTALTDVVDPLNGSVLVKAGDLIDEVGVEQIEKAGIEELRIRSVLTCETKTGVCGKCYGRDLARGTKVNIGEAVGVIAAQSIGEPGTQLTMRTFHIGGAAQRGAEQSNIEASHDGTIQVRNRNIVMNSAGVPVVMGRNTELVLIDGAQRERAKHRVPYGARLLVDNDSAVTKGQKLAEWDPYTLPVITEKAGKAVYVDLVEGVSMREVIDDSTGISSRVVVDWKGQPRGGDLRPRIAIQDADGKPIMLANGQEARYLLSLDSVLSVENGQEVHAGDILARIPREGGKNRDITGGLPRVAELFEARKPKDFAIICDVPGRIEFGKDYKNKRRVLIVPEGEGAEPVEYLIPKTKRIAVQEGDFVERGDLLIDGNPVPHDILRVLGIEKLAEYLVNEIQEVYRLQGVKINDKHIETIARQMLQKVEITDAGESTFLIGEQVDKGEFEAENAKLISEKLKPAKADPVLLGITKASLQTKSFISAASFQETTRVLTEAAVSGRVDTLQGLKENVIVGRLIPAGTGGVVNRLKAIAGQRDRAILAAGADGEDQPIPTLEEEQAAD